MVRFVGVLLVVTLSLVAPALAADAPRVLQPNASAYSSAELSVLLPAMAQLETLLSTSKVASRRYFAPDDWQSRDFARYTAGTLAQVGYNVRLVSNAGWSDSVHTWVLVGIPLSEKTAWVPVEASPSAGQSQQTLGYVPKGAAAAGNLQFPANYTTFSTVAELPANLPPVAAVLGPTSGSAQVGDTVQFLGLGSHDSDGQIVLYLWDFGDGGTAASDAPVTYHSYDGLGIHTISLTVIDTGGKRGSATLSLQVTGLSTGTGGSGCGCGK